MHRLHCLLSLSLCLAAWNVAAGQEADTSRASTRLQRYGQATQSAPLRTTERVEQQAEARQRIIRQPTTVSREAMQTTEAVRASGSTDIASTLRSLNASEPYDVSSSGRYLVATQRGRGLMLFDTATGRTLRQLQNAQRDYALVKISSDARWIAGVRAEDPDQIDLWRADNGRLVQTIQGTGGVKRSLEFMDDGALGVMAANGRGVTYSVPDGEVTGGFGTGSGRAAMQTPRREFGKVTINPPTPAAQSAAPPASSNYTPRTGSASRSYQSVAPNNAAAVPNAAVQAPSEPVVAQPQQATPQAAIPRMSAPATAAPMAAPPVAEPFTAAPAAEPLAAEPMAASPAPETTADMAPRMMMREQAPASFAPPEEAAPAAAMPDEAEWSGSEPAAAAPVITEEAPVEVAGGSANLEAEAVAQAQPVPPEDLSKVTVHYATNRNRLGVADRTWLAYFKGFFFSLPAVIGYVVVVLLLLVLPWFGKRSWAATAFVTGVVVLCSMAALEAYVRSQLRDELSGELYGSLPGELNYGTCEISVPKPENRTAGEVNRPLSVWVFEAPENEDKHFVLKKVNEHADKDAFFTSLSAQLARSEDGASLLFIHGYNVSFEDAVFRTAQLAVDLKYRGAPITFSWPSYADPVKYTFDEQNAEVSIPALAEFLQDLSNRSGAKRIHIIAHSMGNRVLAGALRSMSPDARVQNKAMFREIVMAAPDIDSRVFKAQVLPHIADNTQHCTLYASNRDRALMMSRYFHNYQRLGETEPQLIVATGMDTIDASLVDTSLLGHSYIGDVQSIVSDLHDLVVVGKRPMERGGLEEELLGELIYWAIKPSLQTAVGAGTRR